MDAGLVARAHLQQDRHADGKTRHRIDEMKTACIEEPKARDAVMHGMKAPEPGPFMGEAVLPIETEFEDDETEGDLESQGPGGGPIAATIRCEPGGDAHENHEGDEDLCEALTQDRVSEVWQYLAVILQPLALVRHEANAR